MSLYQLLNVVRTATIDEIRKSFRRIAVLLHPDKGGDTSKFQQIVRAKEILTDEELKRIYDKYGDGRRLRKAITRVNRFGSASRNKAAQPKSPETGPTPSTGMVIIITKDQCKQIKPDGNCVCGINFENTSYITQCFECNRFYHLNCAKLTINDARNHQFRCGKCNTNEIYEVEKVIDRKEENSKILYLIKWKDYEYQDWVERESLDGCAKLINNWLKSKGLATEMEEDPRLGSEGTNVVSGNWISMKEFHSEVERICSYIRLPEQSKLPIIELDDEDELLVHDAVYIHNYQNHAYILRYVSDSDLVLLADGTNTYRENVDVQNHFKNLVNKQIKSLNFSQQPSDNKCGSSAAFIAVEMMRPTITEMNTLRVNKQRLMYSTKRLHQVPQINKQCQSKFLSMLECYLCRRKFASKKKMICHQLQGSCSKQPA